MVRIKGFPAQQATFRGKTDARRWAEQVESSIRDGRLTSEATEAKRHALGELLDRYDVEILASCSQSSRTANGATSIGGDPSSATGFSPTSPRR